ncbi:MAG: hypothetical protein M1837_003849 [Sclerophora amabilis]|nr:MAG: hypothetical protein M1837_003849 [Sclerophora amabilis]
MTPDSDICIIGAGAFGTSTAYHLSLRGYKNIRVLDRYPSPSCEAAANDLNKVIRSDYNEPLYATLGLEAIEAWKTEKVFEGLYHQPGWILSAQNLSVPFVEGSIETSKRLQVKGMEVMSVGQIRKRFPVFTGGLDGWNINVWNPTAGWASAREALRRMALAAQENGVEYISGDEGWMKEMIISSSGECTGVITMDGNVHTAEVVVLATGAWTPSLIDLSDQLTAKGHSIAHIQLSPAEQKRYEDMPIMDNLELGYFFPPGPDGIIKLAHSNFITNTTTDATTGITTSIPHTFTQHPSDDLPFEIEAQMRSNIGRVLPELSSREFSYTRICWDADTSDRHFLITPHPDHQNLFLAAGGSAHGFKFMPILGKYISDMLEGNLDPEMARVWAWRPGQVSNLKNLAHLDPEMELRDLTGWMGRRKREAEHAKL